MPRFYILLSAQLERAITMTISFRCNFSHQQCLWIAEAWLNFWFLYVIFIYIMFCKYICIYIYIYVCMYVCIDILLFQFVLLCFDFFLWKWGRMKNISKVTYLYLFLLNVYEFHNFIPFCYLNTEQMKNVDPLFSKSQYGTKSWRGT